MKSMSISLRKSTKMTSINHNNRTITNKELSKNTHIDKSRLQDNVYHQEDIKEVYSELFDEAVGRYNAKQKRNDRKIENYYTKIKGDKKTSLQQEMIVQVGKLEDMEVGSKEWNEAKEIMQEYMNSFQERNPNLRTYNMALHLDESVPHLHLNFVPFYHSSRGLDTRVGMDKALNEMGFTSDHPFAEWRDREVGFIEELMNQKNISRELVGTHDKYLTVPEYKEMKQSVKDLEVTINHLESLHESVEKNLEEVYFTKRELEKFDIEPNGIFGYSKNDVEELIVNAKALKIDYLQLEKESEHQLKAIENQANKIDSLKEDIGCLYEKLEEKEEAIERLNTQLDETSFENLSYRGYIRSLGGEKEKDYKMYYQTLKAFKTEILGYLKEPIREIRKFGSYLANGFSKLTGYNPDDKLVKDFLGRENFSVLSDLLKKINKQKNRNYDI